MGEVARDVGDQRREFLERRLTGIGATDSPKILGLSRWGTPLTVYREKTSPVQPDETSLPAWLGLKLQATVGELYATRQGVTLRADNRHHRSKEHDFIVAHLDFRVRGQPHLLVEAKTKAYENGFGPDGSAEVPPEFWVQVQHEMYVTGATEAHLAVLFGHHTFNVYPVQRDQEFLDRLVPRLVDFWTNNVQAGIPPAPIGHYLDDQLLREQHPSGDGSLKAATPEQEALARELRGVRMNAKQLAQAQEALENRLKVVIGDSDGITGAFGKITWKRSKDGTKVDWQHVASAYGKVIDELLEMANPGEDDDAVSRLRVAQAVYQTAESLATVTTPGSRRFIVDLKED